VRLTGVRLDSGDIAELAARVRSRFDDAGMPHVRILASGDLDEYRIAELLRRGAPVDAFGVGTMLGTSYDAPALGGVFKLVAQDHDRSIEPVMKRSTDKVTEPGMHQVFRGPDGDMVALHDERPDGRALLEPVMQHGRAADVPALDEVRRRCRAQVGTLRPDIRRLEDPAPWPVRRSPVLEALRTRSGAGR